MECGGGWLVPWLVQTHKKHRHTHAAHEHTQTHIQTHTPR